jgi:hypothetical protein
MEDSPSINFQNHDAKTSSRGSKQTLEIKYEDVDDLVTPNDMIINNRKMPSSNIYKSKF